MTRETKIGLVVAGSFLCLVCIVVASKWRNGEAPTKGAHETSEPPVRVAAANPPQPAPKKEIKSDKEVPHVVFPKIEKPNASDVPILSFPPLVKPDEKKDNFPAPPVLPPVVTVPPPGALPSFPALENKGPAAIAPPPVLPPAPETKGSAVFAFPPPAVVEEKKGPALVPPPSFGTLAPMPDPKQPLIIAKPDNAPPSIPPLTTNNPVPAFPGISPPPTLPPLNKAVTPPPAVVTFAKDSQPRPGVTIVPNDPGVTLLPPNMPRIVNSNDVPNPAPISPPNFSSVGPVVDPFKAKPAAFAVKDVNVDAYVCQPGETNFGLLALRLYGNDKYAEALLAYNRAHVNQVRNGVALLQSPPALSAGQMVLQPPVGILERDYASSIRGSVVTPTIPPVKLAAPAPLVTVPGVAAVSNPPTLAAAGSYTVRNASGESILDIAERNLGNRARWNEIYRLNPNYQPQFRIPAGTVLKMPS